MTLRLENSDGFLFVVEETVGKASELVSRTLNAIRGPNGDLPSSSSPLVYVGSIDAETLHWVVQWIKNGGVFDAMDVGSISKIIKAAELLEMQDLFECATLKMATIPNDSVEVVPVTASSPPVFNIFPEIWDNILPFLSGTEFQAVINSIPMWRSTFKTITADRLLPLCLPILLNRCGFSKFTELLRWRGVNKATKSVIDFLMEESVSPANCYANLDSRTPSLVPATGDAGEEELRVLIDKLQYRYRFTTVNQLRKFIDKMKPTLASTISPFIKKLLVFDFDNVEGEMQNIKELGMSLLTQFGHGISNFSIYNVQMFDLPSLLAHLPNLKVLTLNGNVRFEFDEGDVALWETKVNLMCLELLNVKGLDETNTGALLNPLLRCCGEGLTRLVCSDDLFYSPANLVKLQAGGFPNLRFLQVHRLAYGFVDRRWQPELGATMPLEQIELIDNFGDFEDVTLNEILASIRIFEHTLSHLKLCLKLGEVGKKKVNLLPFPRLTTFTTNLRFASTNCFPAFVRLQAEILTEMNFEVSCEYLPQEVFVWLMGLFQPLPNLIKIRVFCGYRWDYDTENAEIVELERNGIVRRFKYEYKDQCYTNT